MNDDHQMKNDAKPIGQHFFFLARYNNTKPMKLNSLGRKKRPQINDSESGTIKKRVFRAIVAHIHWKSH